MQGLTETEVANMALGQAGTRSTIANMRENSNEANKVRLYFDTTRDALLRAAMWNFSMKTDYLTLLKAAPGTPENPSSSLNSGPWNPATMPALPWFYSYVYPPDAVRMWQVLPYVQTGGQGAGVDIPIFSVPTEAPSFYSQKRGVRFQEGMDFNNQGDMTRCILTNQEQAIGRWGVRVRNPALWDSQFVTAMVGSLAWQLCIPLSGDKTLAKMGHDAAVEAIRMARVTDGNEGTSNVNRIPDWIAVRGYSGDWVTQYDSFCQGWENPTFLGL